MNQNLNSFSFTLYFKIVIFIDYGNNGGEIALLKIYKITKNKIYNEFEFIQWIKEPNTYISLPSTSCKYIPVTWSKSFTQKQRKRKFNSYLNGNGVWWVVTVHEW